MIDKSLHKKKMKYFKYSDSNYGYGGKKLIRYYCFVKINLELVGTGHLNQLISVFFESTFYYLQIKYFQTISTD